MDGRYDTLHHPGKRWIHGVARVDVQVGSRQPPVYRKTVLFFWMRLCSHAGCSLKTFTGFTTLALRINTAILFIPIYEHGSDNEILRSPRYLKVLLERRVHACIAVTWPPKDSHNVDKMSARLAATPKDLRLGLFIAQRSPYLFTPVICRIRRVS